MEEFKKHHNKCIKKYTVQDEKGKDLIIEQIEYENANVYMPIVMKALDEMYEKITKLQTALESKGVAVELPSVASTDFSRVKKPIRP